MASWPLPGSSQALLTLTNVGWQSLIDYLSSRHRAAGVFYVVQYPVISKEDRALFLSALFHEISMTAFCLATATIKHPHSIVAPKCFRDLFQMFYDNEGQVDPLLIEIKVQDGEGERDRVLNQYVEAWWMPGNDRMKFSFDELVAIWRRQSATLTRTLPSPPPATVVLSELTLDALREARSLLRASLEIVDEELKANRDGARRVRSTLRILKQEQGEDAADAPELSGLDLDMVAHCTKPTDQEEWKDFFFFIADRIYIAIQEAPSMTMARDLRIEYVVRLSIEFQAAMWVLGVVLSAEDIGRDLNLVSFTKVFRWMENRVVLDGLFAGKIPSDQLEVGDRRHRPTWIDTQVFGFRTDRPLEEVYQEWLELRMARLPLSTLSLDDLAVRRQKILRQLRTLMSLKKAADEERSRLKDQIKRVACVRERWSKHWESELEQLNKTYD
ncbi:hypothetical protein CC1G_12550 [Coprinopsis cinerea okayama7|uniref:Uncharacterized protein n=1 Tax=Coprinopsis cinerea (strain Okayama-7 / 130 / ATCC MYA-4618 / FGSC 9003) TaxID=240176 RepID=A8PH79_COPC7|nr:hypothetical protein CC1G_12550 [Coprinopsis cinerea okayama7\|eukprot:XP_001841352.1 hypothetical protein CC1G_12550 [Coprinopsis cinerea okayama7\